jgi:hypothetical protein
MLFYATKITEITNTLILPAIIRGGKVVKRNTELYRKLS